MAKKKKKKRNNPLDFLTERLKAIIDSAGIRDIVYLAAYIAAVNLIYTGIEKVEASPLSFFPFIQFVPLREEREGINFKTLSISLVAAYMILKIDVEDVTSAIGKLSSAAVKGLVAVP